VVDLKGGLISFENAVKSYFKINFPKDKTHLQSDINFVGVGETGGFRKEYPLCWKGLF